MKITLNNLRYYYLTVPRDNNERKKHMLEEFKELNLKEVNPIPASYFDKNKNLLKHQKTRKSGATGWLKIIDLASQEMGNNFQPFVIFEDDVKKYRKFPEYIEIPDDGDLLYLGLSQFGKKGNISSNNFAFYQNVNLFEEIIRIFNMVSTHGILICSMRGMLSLQKCLLEDFHKNQGWDRAITDMQPYLNIYALKEPLVYQYGKLGGEELFTKINYKKLNNKIFPKNLINNTNISIITNYNIFK